MRPAVLITGGAKRIGAALSRAFGEAGWHVVIHYGSSRAEAERLAAELPSAECVQCDLADSDAGVAMVRELASRLGDWRMLINCAAVFREDGVDALDPGIFAEAMTVNVATPVRMAQAYLREARADGGKRVIEFTDMKLRNPNPDFFSYSMSKFAFDSTIRMMAMAASDPADRIYGIAPGAMLPSFDQKPEEHQVSGRMNLLHRITPPGELADAALFLSEGWLASGETLYIDSGQHLLSQPRDVLFLARE
ncbi:MAG: SDR family oxidoreductase [Novosphingobium sp.]|nr:SDR family oxidoreductase [Novosphingobium sp.]MCP5402281.1 SDR family oxidoreductase [Novosphingobium sp.]